MSTLTFAELAKKVEEFDFSTLEYPFKGIAYPIFYHKDRDIFLRYPNGTDPEMAESHNPVIYVGGVISSSKPEIQRYKRRIMLHHTKEIV